MKLTAIQCDGGTCTRIDAIPGFRGDARAVRKVLRKRGWAVALPGGRDLCPACAALEREKRAAMH